MPSHSARKSNTFFPDLSATNQRAPWPETKHSHIIKLFKHNFEHFHSHLDSRFLSHKNCPRKRSPFSGATVHGLEVMKRRIEWLWLKSLKCLYMWSEFILFERTFKIMKISIYCFFSYFTWFLIYLDLFTRSTCAARVWVSAPFLCYYFYY